MLIASLFLSLAVPTPDQIELRTGRVIVGEIQSRNDPMQILTPRGALSFTADQVRSVRTRRELLRTYKTSLKQVGKRERGRLILAEFSLGRGLYDEYFDNLDALLEDNPDHGNALEMLGKSTGSVLLDRTLPKGPYTAKQQERLIIQVGGSSPARAYVARKWLTDRPTEELLPQLNRLSRSLRKDVRRGCVTVMCDLEGDEILNSLIKRSIVDSDEKVREISLGGALQSQHPNLVGPYIKALKSGDARLRAAAYPALSALRDPRAVASLIGLLSPAARRAAGDVGLGPRGFIQITEQRTFIQDFEVEIAQGAVIADPVIGVLQSGVTLDVAAAPHGGGGPRSGERRYVSRMLAEHTGQNFGEDYGRWANWWNANGKKFLETRLLEQMKVAGQAQGQK